MNLPGRWERYERYPYLLAKYGGLVLILGAVFALLYRLRVVVIPILFAGLFAYLLAPSVDFLARRRVHRTVASALAVFLFLFGAFALVLLVVPTLYAQMRELIERVPMMLDVLDDNLAPILADRFGVTLHVDRTAIAESLRQNLETLAAPSAWLVSRVFQSVITLGLAVFNVVIVIVFTFYLSRSYHEILKGALGLIPERHRSRVTLAAGAVDEALAGFIRGQVIVCVIMAAVYSIGLSIIGVQGGAVIGMLAGLLNFVPYLGTLTGLVLSLLSAALDYGGPGSVVAVLALFVAGPLLDATLVTPNVLGQRVGLNPFLVIVALLAGAELLGFLGLLLAVPTAAVLRGLVRVWLPVYRASRFYQGDPVSAREGTAETP